jgi:hypothetical protein
MFSLLLIAVILCIIFKILNVADYPGEYDEIALSVDIFILTSIMTVFVPVMRIRDIWVRTRTRIRIVRSVPLTNGSGCGSGRPNNIRILRIRAGNTGTSVHLQHFTKIKSHKKVQNSRNQVFLTIFA